MGSRSRIFDGALSRGTQPSSSDGVTQTIPGGPHTSSFRRRNSSGRDGKNCWQGSHSIVGPGRGASTSGGGLGSAGVEIVGVADCEVDCGAGDGAGEGVCACT